MNWLLIGYMFLFIHRPFEIWPVLGDLRIERVYMISMLLFWAVWPGKRVVPNLQHLAYFFFASAVALCWMLSPWMEAGQRIVEDWFKVVVFYTLLVTSVSNTAALRGIVFGFLLVMFGYELHSLREFIGGRHVYRMGITRLIGVDTSLGDPNSFGASVVIMLPLIPAFWQLVRSQKSKLFLIALMGLSVLCILLTGSRSSFLGMAIWGGLFVLRSKYRWVAIAVLVFSSPAIFLALPDSLQNRLETIVDSSVGPENARISGEGRVEGLYTGFELLAAYPISGVGPGAWRPATGSPIESHNLPGQLVGEMGIAGIFSFGFVLVMFAVNLRGVNRLARSDPGERYSVEVLISRAVGMGVFLMLVMGLFGHNLYRHNWLWYGGFLIVARFTLTQRIRRKASEAVSVSYRRIVVGIDPTGPAQRVARESFPERR